MEEREKATYEEFFKLSEEGGVRVSSREGSRLEFKANFSWQAVYKYIKTMAAFANREGGSIVFGVTDRPREAVGMSPDSYETFWKIDPKDMTKRLQASLSSELDWHLEQFNIGDRKFGAIVVEQSNDRPVIVTRSYKDILREGDILYRYRGTTERIRAQDLKKIIEDGREKEAKAWSQLFQRIAVIGVDNVALIDSVNKEIVGRRHSLYLTEEMLRKVKFVNEGSFSEKKGAPALKLIAQANAEVCEKLVVVNHEDIFRNFFNQELNGDAMQYIDAIAGGTTAYVPIYFYIKKSKNSVEDVIKELENLNTRGSAKKTLLRRLKEGESLYRELRDTASSAYRKKYKYKNLLLKGSSPDSEDEEIKYCFQAINTFTKKEVLDNKDLLLNILSSMYSKLYKGADSSVCDSLRRAICWVDEALYK